MIEGDGDHFYIYKKSFELKHKPYCFLLIGDDLFVGCDFAITVFNVKTLKVTHTLENEHRITHLY
jgi:hypothetical protein